MFFDERHGEARLGERRRRGQAAATRANYNRVVIFGDWTLNVRVVLVAGGAVLRRLEIEGRVGLAVTGAAIGVGVAGGPRRCAVVAVAGDAFTERKAALVHVVVAREARDVFPTGVRCGQLFVVAFGAGRGHGVRGGVVVSGVVVVASVVVVVVGGGVVVVIVVVIVVATDEHNRTQQGQD